jgi:hypothetical protein
VDVGVALSWVNQFLYSAIDELSNDIGFNLGISPDFQWGTVDQSCATKEKAYPDVKLVVPAINVSPIP